MSEVDEKPVMIALSRRAKEAIKVALAMVIVYAIAMQMGWDKPYWGGFSVVTINILSRGVSLSRGLLRSLGTLVGAVAGLAIVGLFPQERWLLMLGTSLFVGVTTYLLMGKSKSYFWALASITGVLVIGVGSPFESQSIFQVAVLRTEETTLGAIVYILVAAFIWPTSSVGMFSEACRKLWATQTQLYRSYRSLMCGKGTAADSRPLRLQELQQLDQVGQLLNAAEIDSYEVWEVRHRWRQFRDQSTALMEALERWRGSFAEIRSLDPNKLLPDLDAVSSQLDRRFEQIGRMLAGEAQAQPAQAIALTVDQDEMRALTHFQRAAVVVTRTQLENLERLSRSLFDCVADIRGYARQAGAPAAEPTRRRGWAIDPDRFAAVVRVIVTLWLGFFLWVYVDPPGHAMFPMMTAIFAIVIVMTPQASPASLFLSWGAGAAFAGVLYIFVMPHLSGFAELAILIFGAFFAIQYLLSEQLLARVFTQAGFLVLISIDNQQTYSFSAYANATTWQMLSIALALATAYIPTSPRPEKVFLRLLRRYFRHAEFLLEGLAPDRPKRTGVARRLQSLWHQNDLLAVPGKLAACGKQIDYRGVPDDTPEQVQALVAGLYALAYRIEDLVEAGSHPQAEPVRARLRDDLQSWHQVIEARLLRQADDPTQFIEPSADVRKQLAERLARLEAGVQETFARTGKDALRAEDYSNLYRLLGSYRGLSEAAIGYAHLAEDINWARWREARF